LLLGLLVVIEAVVSLIFLGRLSRDSGRSQESLEAILRGQEHIAELTAEVLRRTPPR
jgi:hypothetical protein